MSQYRERSSQTDPAGHHIPGAVETVVSAGTTVDGFRNVFGSVRLRYFGPRPLIEDNSIRSNATTLVNMQIGYKVTRTARMAIDVFNLFDVKNSDIDYYYRSRLPGESLAGVNDIHSHATLPRTVRVNLILGL
jgi:hypothetical protein